MQNDKKVANRVQTDNCKYLARELQSKGQDQLLSEMRVENGQKSDNCQDAADILWFDGYVAMDDNAEGCC